MDFKEDATLDDLEKLGVTEEEAREFLPKEEPQEETPAEETAEPQEKSEESETAPVGEETTVTDDHSDNLKAALKEERARRKALRDELDTLKAQMQPIKQQPIQPTQAPDVLSDIRQKARAKAIESLKIEGNPSDLMFADPEKYEEFVSERARLEYEAVHAYQENQRVYGENVAFVNELRNIPDLPAIMHYANEDLDEMPRKQSRKIEEAYDRVDKGKGNKDDFQVLRDYVAEVQKKMTGTNTSATTQTQPQANVSGLAGKLEQAAQLPKANQLSGGKTKQMSWEEVEKLAREEKWDEIPPDMLKQLGL